MDSARELEVCNAAGITPEELEAITEKREEELKEWESVVLGWLDPNEPIRESKLAEALQCEVIDDVDAFIYREPLN